MPRKQQSVDVYKFGGVSMSTPESVRLAAEHVLHGTDNQVAIYSKRYNRNPLVVTGPGAGAEVTAAGVLNDILAITKMERRQRR